jgi:hypothetical protein
VSAYNTRALEVSDLHKGDVVRIVQAGCDPEMYATPSEAEALSCAARDVENGEDVIAIVKVIAVVRVRAKRAAVFEP